MTTKRTAIYAGSYAAAFLLTGCGATMPQTVNKAIPVECRETVPERPAMPTESLAAGVGLDAFVQAATAEIERREAYEGQLRTALVNCTTPIKPP